MIMLRGAILMCWSALRPPVVLAVDAAAAKIYSYRSTLAASIEYELGTPDEPST